MIEEQVLNFVIQVVDKGASVATSKIQTLTDRFRTSIEKMSQSIGKNVSPALGQMGMSLAKVGSELLGRALTVGLTLFTAGMTSLVGFVADAIEEFQQFYGELIDYRKQIGMTTEDMESFGFEAIDAARKYGVEIDKVGRIASIVAVGMKGSMTNVAVLSAKLAALSQETGANSVTLAEFTQTLMAGLKKPEEYVLKLIYSSIKAGRQYKISADETMQLQNQLLQGWKNLGDNKYRDKIIAETTKLGTAMRSAGADAGTTAQVLLQMMDSQSNLGVVFQAANYDVEEFGKKMKMALSGAKDMPATWQAATKSWESSGWDLEKLNDSLDKFGEISKGVGGKGGFDTSMKKSVKELQDEFRNMRSGLEKWNAMWGTITNSAIELVSVINGPLMKALGDVADTMETMWDYWGKILGKWKIFQDESVARTKEREANAKAGTAPGGPFAAWRTGPDERLENAIRNQHASWGPTGKPMSFKEEKAQNDARDATRQLNEWTGKLSEIPSFAPKFSLEAPKPPSLVPASEVPPKSIKESASALEIQREAAQMICDAISKQTLDMAEQPGPLAGRTNVYPTRGFSNSELLTGVA